MKGTLIFTVHTKQGINDRNLYSLSLGSDRSFILSFVGGGDGFLGLWGRPGNKSSVNLSVMGPKFKYKLCQSGTFPL